MDESFVAGAIAKLESRLPVTISIYRRIEHAFWTGKAVLRAVDGGRVIDIWADEIHSGELPAFTLDTVDGTVVVQGNDAEAWAAAIEDRDALRVFALLDPRFLAERLQGQTFSLRNGHALLLGHVRLDRMPFSLPDQYLRFLKDAPPRDYSDFTGEGPVPSRDAHPLEHPAAMVFDRREGELLEVRLPDLHPRRGEVIIAVIEHFASR